MSRLGAPGAAGNFATQPRAIRTDGAVHRLVRGSATTFAAGDGLGVTGLSFGVSLSRPKWQRSSWW